MILTLPNFSALDHEFLVESTYSPSLCTITTNGLICNVQIGLGANKAFAILTGLNYSNSSWTYTIEVTDKIDSTLLFSKQSDSTDLVSYVPVPEATEEEIVEMLDVFAEALVIDEYDIEAHPCGGQFFTDVVNERPVIGFSHDCMAYEAVIVLHINQAVFGADADPVLFSSGYGDKVTCAPCTECTLPDTYDCAVRVHGAADSASSSFAIILND